MSEEFNIFKNLEELRGANFLDQIKNLEFAKTIDHNESQDGNNDDFDFEVLLNNNVKKTVSNKEKNTTPEKKSKKNVKLRRTSSSTDGSISPILPLLEKISKEVDTLPVKRRTRKSVEMTKMVAGVTIEEDPNQPENIQSSSKKKRNNKCSGRGRSSMRSRSRKSVNHGQNLRDSSSESLTSQHSSNEIFDLESDIPIMERFLQQGRRGRTRVMRARRNYISEIAARSTQVDFIDLVSSPIPRIEGTIVLDSDTEETPMMTRSRKKRQKEFTIHSPKNKMSINSPLNISFDEDNPELSIKINWKGKPESFTLRKYQKFSYIFKQLAERENTDMDYLVFNLNNRIILPDDTPDSIDYKIFQFIDGRVLANTFNSPVAPTAFTDRRNANKITLKIQSDKWKRPLQIDIMKTDKFRILYIKCAEELRIGIDQLKLSFDGELLDLEDTPADLDMEGDEAVDLRIKD